MPIAIGVAAPRFDAGDIAAIWLAYRMYVPALAARAPVGPTQVATGTVEFRMSLIIARIDVSSPPGVSSSSTTSEALWAWACARPREKNSAVAGLIMPSSTSTS